MRTGSELGRDFTLDDLRSDGFEAVFVAVGAQLAKQLGLPGEDADGVMDALHFLRSVREGSPVAVGPRVGVIGAGDTAAVGDVLGRFITIEGRIALPSLDERTVGLPLAQLGGKRTIGLAAGPGRGPVALGALRAACMQTFVTDEATAGWVLAHD